MISTSRFMNVLAITAVTGALWAVEAHSQETSPATEYRQSVMQGFQSHRTALAAILGQEIPHQSHLLGHATAINHLASMLSDIFPEGSGGEDTRARDEIWQDWETFSEGVATFQAAAAALAEAAESGDVAATQEAATQVQRGCGGCHRPFRKPVNR